MISLFDAHCDTLFRAWREGHAVTDAALAASVSRAAGFEAYTQVYALFTDKSGRAGYDAMMTIAKRELSDVSHRCVFSIEGAEGIDCDEGFLPQAYADGVRAINLCWNYDNAIAGAAMDGATGLTEKGRRFVREMERLGIYADVSHLSDTAFWDLIEMAGRPVIASHSNSRRLCPWARNLTDKMFLAIAKTGGCVGLNFCADFVGRGRDIDALVDHAEHFLALGGERNLGLGSDFDGCDTVAGLGDLRDMEALYNAMLRRGWAEALVQDIFYNNFERLFA